MVPRPRAFVCVWYGLVPGPTPVCQQCVLVVVVVVVVVLVVVVDVVVAVVLAVVLVVVVVVVVVSLCDCPSICQQDGRTLHMYILVLDGL